MSSKKPLNLAQIGLILCVVSVLLGIFHKPLSKVLDLIGQDFNSDIAGMHATEAQLIQAEQEHKERWSHFQW